MKYLIVILLFLTPLVTKSQVDSTIKIPTSVAKQIAKELVNCDSVKAILPLIKEELKITQKKVILKDSIISKHIQQSVLYEQRIVNEEKKFDTQTSLLEDLKKQNKKLKTKSTFAKIGTGFLTSIIAYLYLVK